MGICSRWEGLAPFRVCNPYAKQLKKQVTLRIRPDVIDYFKDMAEETGIPYQALINLYL